MIDASQSIEACAAHYGDAADAMRDYLIEGQEAAKKIPNRGPIRFDDEGQLHPDIRAAYSDYGFYIFEAAITAEELADLEHDLNAMKDNFPVEPYGQTDAKGRPALGSQCKAPNLHWAKPLSDPLGGTELLNGRHQVKLFEPEAANDAPAMAPFILTGHLQFSDACLRVYGHPDLLRTAASIHGEDFAPFNEAMFMKYPGLGAAVSWHQDGDTHWDHPEFDEDIHGFNYFAQVYGSTAVNGVWVVPGSHKIGRIDIKAKIKEIGHERIPDAVPILSNPGDVVICNRQILHGSFANTGFEPRVSINFGFHRRSSVLNVKGAGMHSEAVVYTDDIVKNRSRVIGYAIDARRQRFPDETPFHYKPFENEAYIFDEAARANIVDYNMQDLSI